MLEFNTLGDPELERLATAAIGFCDELRAGTCRRWLSKLGPSGAGKTYLARAICKYADDRTHYRWALFKQWSTFMGRMRSGNYNVAESVEDLVASRAVVAIDDIGVGSDTRDFGIDLLLRVMDGRRNKPTLFTSNLLMPALAEIDTRIASRLRRCGEVVEVDTTDYALRGKPSEHDRPAVTGVCSPSSSGAAKRDEHTAQR